MEMGYSQFSTEIPVFNGLKQHTNWKNIEALYKKLKTPVSNSKTAFTIAERDLTPECIVHDPVTESFYLGSMWKHKIVKIDKNYQASDFTSSGQDGLRAIAGMKIDSKSRILYALSIVTPIVPSCDLAEAGLSELYKYNLDTGKLIKKYKLYDKNSPHLFNDLVVTGEGNVYITDSDDSSVFTIDPKKDELELFIKADEFINPNGIAIDDTEKNLFIATSGIGICKINLETGKYKFISHSSDITLSGVDGMYFFKNSLVCVQNSLNRIIRFYLNENADTVTKSEIIESENPDFVLPTTGTIVNGTFYYIANSQIYSMGRDKKLLPVDKLKDIIILKTDLD
jgi:outer membrane protein assembly factor BamB